jgi:hypothetical protein
MSPGRDRHLFSHRGLERPPLSTRTSLEPIGLRAMSAADEPTRGHRPLVDPPADRRASVARRPRESLVGRRLIDKLAKLDLSGTWKLRHPRPGIHHRGGVDRAPPGPADQPAEQRGHGYASHHSPKECGVDLAMSGSASRSGEKQARLLSWLWTNSQRRCCHKPFATATGVVPNRRGECGSGHRNRGSSSPV